MYYKLNSIDIKMVNTLIIAYLLVNPIQGRNILDRYLQMTILILLINILLHNLGVQI